MQRHRKVEPFPLRFLTPELLGEWVLEQQAAGLLPACQWCGLPWLGGRRDRRFCSDACRLNAWRFQKR